MNVHCIGKRESLHYNFLLNRCSLEVVNKVPPLGDVDAVEVRLRDEHERGLALDFLPARLPLLPLHVAAVLGAEHVVVLLSAVRLIGLSEPAWGKEGIIKN